MTAHSSLHAFSCAPFFALTGLHGTITSVAKAIILSQLALWALWDITFLFFRYIGHIGHIGELIISPFRHGSQTTAWESNNGLVPDLFGPNLVMVIYCQQVIRTYPVSTLTDQTLCTPHS